MRHHFLDYSSIEANQAASQVDDNHGGGHQAEQGDSYPEQHAEELGPATRADEYYEVKGELAEDGEHQHGTKEARERAEYPGA